MNTYTESIVVLLMLPVVLNIILPLCVLIGWLAVKGCQRISGPLGSIFIPHAKRAA